MNIPLRHRVTPRQIRIDMLLWRPATQRFALVVGKNPSRYGVVSLQLVDGEIRDEAYFAFAGTCVIAKDADEAIAYNAQKNCQQGGEVAA